jgi:hypothetical protein
MGVFADHRRGERDEGDQQQQHQIDELQAATAAA